MSKLGNFYGIGLGPGDPELITLKAVKILQECDVIFYVVSKQSSRSVSGNIINSLPGVRGEKVQLTFTMKNNTRYKQIANNANLIKDYLDAGKNCVFATIGDPLTYSTYGYILEELKNYYNKKLLIQTVPGVNSWSAVAAEQNKVLVKDTEKLAICPEYIADGEIDSDLLKQLDTVVFLKTFKSRQRIVDQLKKENLTDQYEITYGSNIGLKNQFISSDLSKIAQRKNEYLALIINRKKNCEK
ncbi:precorrin-2 C(20)-methyltransferase [Lentisphaerota bacterium WC36G]|nr:precorrin-2 C(20)-methyltransferase [Lentisphaerae bacterium WC36]